MFATAARSLPDFLLMSDDQHTPLPGVSSVAVFSHPNHELAVFGTLQELRPRIVYLTDGGGPDRVEQTREGLSTIRLEDRAVFLDHSENSFYGALLRRDHGFFSNVARQIAETLGVEHPEFLLCDALEFYNPVHDLTLPIVHAAMRESDLAAPIFEVPLVSQAAGDGKGGKGTSYRVQESASSNAHRTLERHLGKAALGSKKTALHEVYSILTDTMGPMITAIPDQVLARETFLRASETLLEPDEDRLLRYEWRARLLLERGEIEEAITYSGHFRPVAEQLWPR